MSQRNLRNATITITDGNSQSVVVKIGEGNFNFSEKQTMEYSRDRGNLDTCRRGDDEPVDVSFDFQWEWLTSSTLSTNQDSLRDIIKGNGFVTTGGECEPYACNITVELEEEICSNSETLVFSDFRWEEMSYDLRAGQISVSGKCNITEVAVS
jgi:hypothetical protein